MTLFPVAFAEDRNNVTQFELYQLGKRSVASYPKREARIGQAMNMLPHCRIAKSGEPLSHSKENFSPAGSIFNTVAPLPSIVASTSGSARVATQTGDLA